MKKSVIYSILLCSILLLPNCKKDVTSTPPANISNTPSGEDINAFFTKNSASAQVFTVSTAGTQTITGAEGTTITIPPLAFRLSGGTQVLGNVVISLTELYTKKEFILNKMQTCTASDLTQSRGMLNITAIQGDETLKLDPAKTLTIDFTTSSTPANDLFALYGSKDPVTGYNFWVPDTAGGPNYGIPVITPQFAYRIISDSLSWTNCGKLAFGNTGKSSFSVTVHGNYNRTNTDIFLSFPTLRSALYLAEPADQLFTGTCQLPIGTNFTIVAISRINGRYFASYTNATMSLNFSLDINLSETNESDILSKLGTL
jgi:hypothetical protein